VGGDEIHRREGGTEAGIGEKKNTIVFYRMPAPYSFFPIIRALGVRGKLIEKKVADVFSGQ